MSGYDLFESFPDVELAVGGTLPACSSFNVSSLFASFSVWEPSFGEARRFFFLRFFFGSPSRGEPSFDGGVTRLSSGGEPTSEGG